MDGRKVRFGILIAAAVVLPSMGYLLGFRRAQPASDDWSAQLKVNHELLDPSLAGVLALRHGDELVLTDAERTLILKTLREDAPGLITAQRTQWEEDLETARRIFSGEEIVTEFNSGASLREKSSRPYVRAEIDHLFRIERIIDKKRWPTLFKMRDREQAKIRKAQLFLLYDGGSEETLHLSERQKRQMRRLASYQTMVTKMKNAYGFDGDYETLPMEESMRVLKTADPGQIAFFSMQAEDFLDPLQLLQLRALVRSQNYVPVP